MTKKTRWLRCEVPFDEAGYFTGRLVRELATPYATARDRAGVAIYDTADELADPVSVWLTERAAELADEEGIKWRDGLVDEDAAPPEGAEPRSLDTQTIFLL